MDKNLFKELTPEEEVNFRKWANENYTPGTAISDVWHPVVQEVCHQMNRSAREPKVRVVMTKLNGQVLNDFEVTPSDLPNHVELAGAPISSTDIELSNRIEEALRNRFDILDDIYWHAQEELEASDDS